MDKKEEKITNIQNLGNIFYLIYFPSVIISLFFLDWYNGVQILLAFTIFIGSMGLGLYILSLIEKKSKWANKEAKRPINIVNIIIFILIIIPFALYLGLTSLYY